MKQIFTIVVLLVSFCMLATSVRAESNPLLTIFEAIKTGEGGTSAINVEKVIDAYNKQGSLAEPIKRLPNLTERDGIIWWWRWIGNHNDLSYSPIAYLEIVLNPRNADGSYMRNLDSAAHQPVVSARYYYEFVGLGFSKKLSK